MQYTNIDDAEIVLKSKVNDNIYYLFSDYLLIIRDGQEIMSIKKPTEATIACFYDIYYVADELNIFFATHRGPDIAYVLDEEKLTINKKGFQK